MYHQLRPALLAAIMTVVGPALAHADDAADIRARLERWAEDFNAGRKEAVCDLFSKSLVSDVAGQGEADYETRCRLLGNKSYVGGGAYQSTLYSCLVAGNEAWGYQMHGGGAADSVLYNCTVVGNLADNITNTNTPIPGAGGVSRCLTVNSIVYGNWDDQYGFHNGRVSTNLYSCTTPADPAWLPDEHNTSDEPRFLAAGSGYGQTGFVPGDYRLRVSSRCVNTGTNGPWAQETTDLDGTPRIRQGFVDMGALECMGYDGTSVLLQ